VPTPRLSGGDRLTILSRWLFRGDKPEEYHFHAGEVLIEEGESLTHRPALLVVEGEIEECIGSYDPDSGPAEHGPGGGRWGSGEPAGGDRAVPP